MTATVVTVTSGKGGVGKTTTTANLAVALALGRYSLKGSAAKENGITLILAE